MIIDFTKRIGVTTSLLIVTMVAGCGDDNTDNSSDPDVQAANTAGNTQGEVLATQARTQIAGTDDQTTMLQIASILHTINDGEIMQANAVLAVSNDADVQDFAHMIITDHQQSNATLDAMLQGMQLSVQDNPISVMLRTEVSGSITQLQQTQAADVPRSYLKMQVQMHQEAYVLVSALIDIDNTNNNSSGSGSSGSGSAGGANDDFDQFVRDTRDMIAKHRDDAASQLTNKNSTSARPTIH
jgi:predicted outer membrane protein